MYYKIKKISNVSSAFQVNLFKHYRRLLAPLNPISTFFQNWLTLISLIVLGYALLQSTFVVFGLSLIWLIFPLTKTLFWYTPISLSFWIFSLSLLTSLHSLKICFSLPKEFRAVLLIEQGLTLKTFLNKGLNESKKIGLLLLLILILFYFFPKFLVVLIWGMPVFIEFYLLAGLTNSFLTQNLTTMPTQTLATFLGFEYNYLNTDPKNYFFFADDFYDNWVDEELDSLEDESHGEEQEDDEEEEDMSSEQFDDYDYDEEDIEDSWVDNNFSGYSFDRTDSFFLRKLIDKKKWYKDNLLPLKQLENQDIFLLRKNFPEFFQLQDISLDLKTQYQKVPLLYNYLKAQRELVVSKKLDFFSSYQPVEKRLWTKTHLNIDVLRLPTATPWYNSGFPQLFDDILSDYEDISDYICEADAADDDFDTDTENDYETFYAEANDFQLFGHNQDVYDEPGSGNEYIAPNWFLITFCYYTIFFWAVLNCFLFLFFCFCGIPDTWILTYRSTAANNVLLYKTLLHMTEQLYTKWGFTKLPVGGYCRLEYFNYMQPAYFPRFPKLIRKYVTYKSGYKLHPWNWWYWGRTYKHWNVYGIIQGSSKFSKNPKFSTFDTFLIRKHSSILLDHRLSLSQNLGSQYINSSFFIKKDKLVDDFYKILEKSQNK